MDAASARPLTFDRDGACLRAFFNIADHWNISSEEQRRLLGVDQKTLEEWRERARKQVAIAIPQDALKRIGCVLSIYGSLVTLLSHARSKDWVHIPNRAPIFEGKSAMALMTTGDAKELERVARYLLGERYS